MSRVDSGRKTEIEKAQQAIERLVRYYRSTALAGPCRKVALTGRKCRNPRIIRTLLGFELQIGGKRFSCPDIPTAQYLELFALIGNKEILVPLDPTRSADIIPGLKKRLDRVFSILSSLEESNKRIAQGLHNRLKQEIQESIDNHPEESH